MCVAAILMQVQSMGCTPIDEVLGMARKPATIKAGIHSRMTATRYHSDPAPAPSLSSSVAQVLLERSPAHARLEHPRLNLAGLEDEPTKAMDLGTVAHKLLLGRGKTIIVVDAPDWRKKDAQEKRDAARAAGKVAILAADYARAEAMAKAARHQVAEIPGCERAFVKGKGKAEAVLLWQDLAGAWCRSMIDWLDIDERAGTATIFDFKSTGASAAPAAASARMYSMGYALQGEFYRRGLLTLRPDLAGRVRVIFLHQETDAPHALTAVEIDAAGQMIASKQVHSAIALWARCLETNVWPSYPQAVVTAELPAWLERQWLDRELAEQSLYELGIDPFRVPTPEQLDAMAPELMGAC